MNNHANIRFDQQKRTLFCEGDWTVLNIAAVLLSFKTFYHLQGPSYQIDGSAIQKLDSAGALALLQLKAQLAKHHTTDFINLSPQHLSLIQLVNDNRPQKGIPSHRKKPETFLYRVGVEAVNKSIQIKGLLSLIGDLAIKAAAAFGHWRRFQLPSIASNIDTTGIQALPIVGLLSFLIGIVLAYQMGLQLQTYGANIFIAYLSGMAIFREFSPLITAIIVAGRTSSSFTAQIGSMKINEEIDAIDTMGLSPTELLVMPKVIGLLLVFPLLIFWSDVFSLIGAMMMSKVMLNVSYYDFLMRLKESVGLKQMMLGLYKAPAFAILIALVGCFQGLRVEANASSIGSQTTKSVVQAIFLIIITDAIFSVVYSWLDL